jgi:tetratricopeptide (TPR) repeat protein
MKTITQRLLLVSLGLWLVYLLVSSDEINPTTTLEAQLAELLQQGEQAGYDYSVALPVWQQGLELAQANHHQSYQARFHTQLGEAYHQLGQYDQAQFHLKQALTHYRDDHPVNNDTTALPNSPAVNDTNSASNPWISFYQQAQTYWQRLYRGTATANHDTERPSTHHQRLNNQCQVLKELGILSRSLAQYELAQDYLQPAFDNYRQLEELNGQAAILTEMAMIDYHQQQYDSALEQLTTARELYSKTKNNQGIGEVASHLGQLYRQQQQYRQALEQFENAFQITTEPSKQGDILVQQGITYRDQQQYDQAQHALERARFFYRNSENNHAIGESQALMQMGLLEYTRHQYPAAIDYFTLALELSQKINYRQGQWDNLVHLARSYRQQDEDDTALQQLRQALAVDSADNTVFVTTRSAVYDDLIQWLQPSPATPHAVTTSADYYHSLKVFELKLQRFASGWLSQYQRQLPTPAPVDFTTTASQLLPSEILFIYNIMAKKTFLWVITGGDTGELRQFTLPITAANLTSPLHRFYDQGMLTNSAPTTTPPLTATLRRRWRNWVQTSYQLYRQLFPRKVRQLLAQIKPHTLYIIPTGPLGTLPFEALVTHPRYSRPRYLIDHYTVAYLPTVTLFSQWRQQLIQQPNQFRDSCQTLSSPQVQELLSPLPATTVCLAQLTQPFPQPANLSNLAASLMSLGVPNIVLKLWSTAQGHTVTEVEAVAASDPEVRQSLVEQARQAKLAMLNHPNASFHHPYFWANSLMYGVEM